MRASRTMQARLRHKRGLILRDAREERAPQDEGIELFSELAIVDVADRDRTPGQGATEAIGELQRQAGI